jgi:hypothetical protein
MSSYNSAHSPGGHSAGIAGTGTGGSAGGYEFLTEPRAPRRHDTMGNTIDSNGGSLANDVGGSMRSVGSRSGAGTPLPQSEHAHVLEGHAELLVPPTLTAVDRATPSNVRALFLGHMRFETTVAEVRWLLYTTASVVAAKAEPRGNGCFVVYLANDEEMTAVRQLHKRLLFDHHGVWYARTAEEAAHMNEYVEHTLANTRRRRLRLPKDCMVVEEPRSTPGGQHRHSPMQHHAPPQQPQSYPSAAVMAYGMDAFGSDDSQGTNMYGQQDAGKQPMYNVPQGGPPGGQQGYYGQQQDSSYGDDALYAVPNNSSAPQGAVPMRPPPMPTYQNQRQ